MDKGKVPKKLLAKFLILAVIGLGSFVIPIQWHGETTILVGILTGWIKTLIGGFVDELILVLLGVSLLGSLAEFICRKYNKKTSDLFQGLFRTTNIYILTKLFAFIVAVLFYATGKPVIAGDMVDLGKTLVALALSLSYLLPFLTETGLMEFVGEITRPFVEPLFKVPSDASLDLIASWLGASSAAVILSAEKYKKGYYTKREVANVMCNFSLVSIPFCLVIASTARVEQHFAVMYGLICVLGIILAIISPRIYPLKSLKDEYYESKVVELKVDESVGLLKRAILKSCHTAKQFEAKTVLVSGTRVMQSICLNLVPIVIGWGILGMAIVEYTPIFQWISAPMGVVLNWMGVESAFQVAPATLAGFVDMFIPALLVTGVESVRTRFIIATLSLIQIIYITEVGTVIIKTDVGVDLKKLVVVFLERTIISLPIIVLVSGFIF